MAPKFKKKLLSRLLGRRRRSSVDQTKTAVKISKTNDRQLQPQESLTHPSPVLGSPPSEAIIQVLTPTQSLLNGAHHFQMRDVQLLEAPNATHITVANAPPCNRQHDRWELGLLPKPPDMSGKWVEYLPKSRQPEVGKLRERESSSADLVLCIHGPAGIGKSTLAGHFSDDYRTDGRLAASIFLGAFSTHAFGPETFIKMIAHEIGCIHPQAIPKIIEAMDQCHGTSLENHFRRYILEPLRSLNSPRPLIIIIDAVDQWRDYPAFIKVLSSFNSESSVVKFIVTDRLNPCASHLPHIDKVSIYTYALGPISKEVIKAYFEKHLPMVPWVDGRKATRLHVEKLVERSGGLPIWASMVIALLSCPFNESPPHQVLEEIIGSRRQFGDSDGLGDLYSNTLRRLFPTSVAQQHFRKYLGATIALQEPLSLFNFSTLVGMTSHLIRQIQFRLSALHTRSPPPGSEKTVFPAATLFHLSFLEYVQATTTESSFAIIPSDSHSMLGLSCLEQVRNLPRMPSLQNHSLSNIQCYAVKYWALHVSNGTPRSSDQWSQTEQCLMLGTVSSETRRQWAILFRKAIEPAEDESNLEDIGAEDDLGTILRNLARWLKKSGDDRWKLQLACLEVAVRIDDSDSEAWSALGRCYRAGGKGTGNLRMNEESVVAFRHALRLRPDPHPKRGESLNYLASVLCSCYEQNGDTQLLVEAIPYHREALTLHPAPHPARSSSLNNLANSLRNLYQCKGDIRTLKEAVSLNREALAVLPPPHPDYAIMLNNLALDLTIVYKSSGNAKALSDAISLHRTALELRPPPHPARSGTLTNLANTLGYLYEYTRDIKPLNEAISLHREALALCPAPHPHRFCPLSNLASALHHLYKRTRGVKTLDEAISLHREALELRPVPHPHRPIVLNSLAKALVSHFDEDGAMETLDEAISLRRELVDLSSTRRRYRKSSLKSLVELLEKRRGVTEDDQDSGDIEELKKELAVLQHRRKRTVKRRYRKSSLKSLVEPLEKRRDLNESDQDRGEIEDLKKELAGLQQHPKRTVK